MRNKKLLYILVPTVFIIWGLIAYKIIKGLRKNSSYQTKSIVIVKKQTSEDTSTFELIENYPDPFLGTIINAERNKKKPNNEPIDFVLMQQANETWTKVNYGGIISGNGQKKELGLIGFNGQKYLLHAGQNIEDIHVIALYQDSVKLSFKSMNKTILKKK